jgi:hypothetical protein
MPFISISIVQARCIFANKAIIATTTPMMGLYSDPVPQSKLIDALAESNNRAGPFVAWSKLSKGWSQRKMSIKNLEVCPTGTT